MTQLNESTSPIAIVSALGGRMNPVERAQGRFLRSDSGHRTDTGNTGDQGGGFQTPPANNGTESAPATGTGSESNNNSGQEFDPTTFWDGPVPDPAKPAGAGPSAGTESGTGQPPAPPAQTGTGNQGTDIGTVIENAVKGFSPPDVMTADAIKAVGEGDYTKFNEGVKGAIQASMNQTMDMTIKVITAFGQKMIEQMDQRIQGSHSQREDLSALHEAIPSAKDPVVAPMIMPIYNRALKLNGGDRTKAANMTKQMLAHMAKGTGGDVGLHVAPSSADSDVPPPGFVSNTNWLEELNIPQR